MVYRDNERSDAPATLLFLHGIGSSKVAWSYVAPVLGERYRVVTVDLLGHGDSDKPVEFGYSMSEQADIVRKFVHELGLSNVVLVGHSYGAGVALETALPMLESGNRWANTSADGRTSIVRGLVLLDPSALEFPKPSLWTLMDGTSVSLLDLLFSTDKRARLVLEVVFWDRTKIRPELEAEYARVFRDPRTSDVYSWIADKQLFKELTARRDREERYRGVVCPVLVMFGEHDRVVPRDVPERLCGLLPEAKCEPVPACGHSPAEEQPALTTARIEQFVQERVLAAPMRVAAAPVGATTGGGGGTAARP